jgi:hypothetical protein
MMGELIPILGMITGLAITLAGIYGFVRLSQGPVGQALGRRIQGQTVADPDVVTEVAELKDQLDQLRRQLEETQERVDFTERLLSQQRPAERLPGAGA